MSSADKLYKQFGIRSGLTKCQAWSWSKLLDTDAIPVIIFRKGDLENQQTTQKPEKLPSMQ